MLDDQKKLYSPALMDGVKLPQGHRATTRNSLLFTTKFTEIPGTHLKDLGKMKG